MNRTPATSAVSVVLGLMTLATACASEEIGVGEAQVACQEFVERRLKAPSTADFSGWSATPDPESSNGWVASGVVDSQNSFGAKIRSSFTCYMHIEGEQWVLEGITGLS